MPPDRITHWIDSETLRKRFWAKANELELTKEQVYAALGVEHIHDFNGTAPDGLTALDTYVMFKGKKGGLMDQLAKEQPPLFDEDEELQYEDIEEEPEEEPEPPESSFVMPEDEKPVQFAPEEVNDQILEQLAVSFPLDAHDFKPAATTRDNTKCLALAYADTRAYTDRLNAVVGLNWHDRLESLNADGSAMICHLTILNTTRSDVGEKESSDKNTATSAAAQAFKRACAKFGLGRYLYDLPQEWVEYDQNRRQISPTGIQHLRNMLAYHTGQEQPKKQRQSQQMTPSIAAKVTTRKGTALGTLKADALDMIIDNADKPDVGPKRAEAARVLVAWLQEHCKGDASATYNARMGI